MKITNVTLTAMALLTPYLFAGEKGQDNHGKDNHDEAGHKHAAITAGPNGGKIFTSTEPHFEFFVTEDRKLRLTFLDKENKPAPAGDATASAIGGERSAPTKMTFAKVGESLISEKPLPEGKKIPLILQVKSAADADNVTERLTVDLNSCPTCVHLEYACTCGH
ncbi:hypothetical protein HZ994_03425 [Akkermansiaceae bacterium]|nr:hypothetical protein HZ994_03425 [Akkermansiaceae bacterium]